MSKTLILVRHGKPEPTGLGKADFERELTPEGAAALARPDGFPRTFSLLSDAERAGAEVWASPAVRAQQTARAAARAIGVDEVRSCEALWQQDHAGFIAQVTKSTARCIVAVGHIPFMNETTAFLADVAASFKPGGAAALEIPDDMRPSALEKGSCRLLWFVQGPKA